MELRGEFGDSLRCLRVHIGTWLSSQKVSKSGENSGVKHCSVSFYSLSYRTSKRENFLIVKTIVTLT